MKDHAPFLNVFIFKNSLIAFAHAHSMRKDIV